MINIKLELIKNANACLFDLDGVLWSSSKAHETSFVRTLEHFNVDYNFEYCKFAGSSTQSTFTQILNQSGVSGLNLFDLVLLKKQLFMEQISNGNVVLSDLTKIKKIFPSKKFGLVTGASKESVDKFLELSKNLISWDVIVDSSLDGPSKPSPSPYLHAINKLKLSAKQCIIFEDSNNGLLSAESSGAKVIHVFGEWGEECVINHNFESMIGCISSIDDLHFSTK